LVSPDFAAAPNFGQPLIQTSEPCGKRSFVRGRFVVISASAAVRAFSHAVETRNEAAWMEMTPRHPLKPRGPYLARQTKSRLRPNQLVRCFYCSYFSLGELPVEQSPHCSSLARDYGRGLAIPASRPVFMPPVRGPSRCSCHRSCTAPAGLLGWPQTASLKGSQHAASG
jgi:hypothetical protein